MFPPDGDYLGSAATIAPAKSFVALFEAQFQALAKTHEIRVCDDEDRRIGAGPGRGRFPGSEPVVTTKEAQIGDGFDEDSL